MSGDDRSEELRDLHNQGQEDASRGEEKTGFFDEHGALAQALGGVSDEMTEDHDAYISGVDHHKSQS